MTALAALLLAVHVWLALSATIGLGVTADETAHLTGGYSYWRFNDYRLQPENGNLPQRWGALPLLALSPHLDPSEAPNLWARSQVWLISQRFFFESGNNTDYMLLCARGTMMLWSVATGLLVFCWTRRLWGDGGALLALGLYSFSPTTLAHAPLVTSDMCATFWLLAAVGAWWRLMEKMNALRLGISLVAFSLAAVAKFSWVLLLPIAALLALWRMSDPAPIELQSVAGRSLQTIDKLKARLGVLIAIAAAHAFAIWIVVWLFFGFRYSAFSPDLPDAWKFFVAWDKVLPTSGFWLWFFETARESRLLPEAYLQGFAYVLSAAQQRGAFLAGNYSTTGWWWFFPYAFLLKSSVAELLASVALAVTAALAWVGKREAKWRPRINKVIPLLVFIVVYGAFSLSSNLNIGHRHILPLYPALCILAGALARPALNRRNYLIAGGLVILAAFESLSVRPHFLAFFNRLAGGPASGWRLLVDSSLDWGQNLPRLARWLAEHRKPDEKIYLSIFGNDDPSYHGMQAEELATNYSFGRTRRWVELEPGLYCISATMLQDVYSPVNGPWTIEREAAYQALISTMQVELAEGRRGRELGEFGVGPEQPLWTLDRLRFARLCFYLRTRRPEATVGHTIFIYRLSGTELRLAVEGTLSELAAAMAANLAATESQGN